MLIFQSALSRRYDLEISRRVVGFHPITTSAFHGASVSFVIKKSARAETLAGPARAVGVTKYSPPSGMRQSARSGSSCFSPKYWVAMNSGSCVMASPSSTVGNNASSSSHKGKYDDRVEPLVDVIRLPMPHDLPIVFAARHRDHICRCRRRRYHLFF